MSDLIQQLKNRFAIEMAHQDRGGVYGLTQRSMAYNSNRIEGSTLTPRQTASIFETGTIQGDGAIFRTKDVEEMTGHFTLFRHMLETQDEPLTQSLIKGYHYHLKAGVFEDIANGYPIGDYKTRRNMVSDIETATPDQVECNMAALLDEYAEKSCHTLSDLAKFHSDFEKIHPFQDGNGRVGRMILFKECLANNQLPFVISDNQKATYYHCLHAAQVDGDIIPLTTLFETFQQEYRLQIHGYL